MRIDPNGKKIIVNQNLLLTTEMTFGLDGALYISTLGFGPPFAGFEALWVVQKELQKPGS